MNRRLVILLSILWIVFLARCAAKPDLRASPTPSPAPILLSSPTAVESTATAHPTPSPTSLPSTATISPTPTPAVLIGAGDIAYCGPEGLGDEKTADLIARLLQQYPQAALFTTGDNVQDSGAAWEYRDCFTPTWGRFKDRLRPAPGNHDLTDQNTNAYYQYFGAAAGTPGEGFYEYKLGEWSIISLNSNCLYTSCMPSSPQVQWLRRTLQNNPAHCTLLYWHHPLFSSGLGGGTGTMKPFWQVAYEAQAEIVVNGNIHQYERFAPQDPEGKASSRGLRQFVAGTGGAPLDAWGSILPNSQFRNNDSLGVILFKLYPGRYEWEFWPVEGTAPLDSGSGQCQ